MMQAAVFAPFFQAVMPINSTPTSSRRTAITTDSSISVVPLWRVGLPCERFSNIFGLPTGFHILPSLMDASIIGLTQKKVARVQIFSRRNLVRFKLDYEKSKSE